MDYSLRRNIVRNSDNKKIMVYGLNVTCDDIMIGYPDLFTEKEKAIEFVNFCNETKPSFERLNTLAKIIIEINHKNTVTSQFA